MVLSFVAFIYFRGIPKYEAKKVEFKAEITPERIERGRKMVTMLCAGCHLDSKSYTLSGKQMKDAPPDFGVVHSANITQHPELGIGKWTDAEIAYLLRTGIKPDGQYLPPYMPKLLHTSDEDLKSIIAFLRSENGMVKATDRKAPKTEASFLVKFLCFIDPSWQPFEYPTKEIKTPDKKDKLVYGEYLVNNYDCFTCHSADFTKLNVAEPRKSKGYLGGGNSMLNMEGKKMITKNITSDKETGIGNWTEAEFMTAMKTGKLPSGKSFQYPMVPYTLMDDEELKALYAYLQSTPPITNKIADNH
ncbi:MAG: cytochrome c [Cytophagales bacterium]|nr:MAG: cytochrome c [Cytophagales bacterium]